MENSDPKLVFVLCKVSFTSDFRPLPPARPLVITVYEMTHSHKIITNGFMWMRKAGIMWLSPDDYIGIYGKHALPAMQDYSKKWADWLRGSL